MGFNANESSTAVVKEGKLFTGLTGLKVVAINPTKAQLEGLGYKPQDEPNYLTVENDVNKARIDFHLQGNAVEEGEKMRAKIAFFIENQDRINKDGDRGEWINDLGRTAWGSPQAAPAEFKWFDASTARACKVGEGDLHQFLINWLNISPNDEAKMENFEALFDGNYSELNGMIQANPNNEIRVLLTVRDGKYQSVYNRLFDRITNKRTSYWESHIKKQTAQGYPPKDDFQGSFLFQEWTEPTLIADPGGAPPVGGSEDQQGEDAPF
jgi:hypothetical protein